MTNLKQPSGQTLCSLANPNIASLLSWPVMPAVPVQSFQEEFFYAWTYDRPKSPWYYVLCGLAFLGITLCTMFPLAPRPIKLVALYVSMTLIIIIFSVLLIRGVVAMTTWILLGRSLWIFPHLLSEVCMTHQYYTRKACCLALHLRCMCP